MKKLVDELVAYLKWVGGPTAPMWAFTVTMLVGVLLAVAGIGIAVVVLIEWPKFALAVVVFAGVMAARAAWLEYRKHRP